jgi:hypothetical protein
MKDKEGTETHLPLQKTAQSLHATRANENIKRWTAPKRSHEVFLDSLFCDQSARIG